MTSTVLETLRQRADHIRDSGIRLLECFSGTHPANRPGDMLVLFSPHGNHYWDELPPEGKQLQAQLLPEVDRFIALVQTMVGSLPNSTQQDMSGCLGRLRGAIEQDGTTWWTTKQIAIDGFRELTDEIIQILETYFVSESSSAYALADTNALLANPDLESWSFEEIGQFTIVLSPTVLSELDQHKINHRVPEVRDKSSKLIRKIKEYRRRGSLQDGIPILKNKISLRTIAAEPDMTRTIPWFDAGHADDRFLATALEFMRHNLGAPCFIVTADINLQNKAEVAGIPFMEVPELSVDLSV